MPGAAVNAAIALYYYLLIIRQAYMVEPATTEPVHLRFSSIVAAAATTVIVIAMGTFPDFFWDCAARAVALLVS